MTYGLRFIGLLDGPGRGIVQLHPDYPGAYVSPSMKRAAVLHGEIPLEAAEVQTAVYDQIGYTGPLPLYAQNRATVMYDEASLWDLQFRAMLAARSQVLPHQDVIVKHLGFLEQIHALRNLAYQHNNLITLVEQGALTVTEARDLRRVDEVAEREQMQQQQQAQMLAELVQKLIDAHENPEDDHER